MNCSACLSFSFVHLLLSGLDQLREANRWTQSFYYAKATTRNVLSHIRQWVFFAVFHGLCFLPASIENVVLFAELMSQSSGYDHIKAIIGSLSFLHKIFDLPFDRESFQLKLTLQSLKRRLAKAPLQALPITIRHLKAMYKYVDVNKPEDLACWCSILVGFFGLLRKKNLVPENLSELDPVKILTVGKILIDKSSGVALLYINFAKNNQFGQKDLVIPLIKNSCQALDPVFHLDLLFSRTQAPKDSPAFSYRSSGRLCCVSYKTFTAKIKSLLSLSGFSPERYSGHSLRRGGATFLHACGASALQIQACGDWQSAVFTRYLYISLEQRFQSQQMMAAQIG